MIKIAKVPWNLLKCFQISPYHLTLFVLPGICRRRGWTRTQVLNFFLLFCTIFHACFSMPLPLMQASVINAVLLRNASFLHLILILFHKCPLALRMWKYFYPMKNKTSCWTRCYCNCLFSLSLSYVSWHEILLIETLILPCWLAGTFLFWELK